MGTSHLSGKAAYEKKGWNFAKIKDLIKTIVYCHIGMTAIFVAFFPRLVSYSAELSIKNCFLFTSLFNLSFAIKDEDLFITQGFFSFSFNGKRVRGSIPKSRE